jgi:hypothetical protein
MSTHMDGALRIFYCYAHQDKKLRDELEKHLGALKRQGHIVSWHDRQIEAGTEWQKEIGTRLRSASLILLLISPDFIHSDYCYSVEMEQALALHQAGRTRVVPILLRPVVLVGTPIAELQLLPEGAKPVTVWRNRDEAFLNVAQHIDKIVRKLLDPSLSPSSTTAHSSREDAAFAVEQEDIHSAVIVPAAPSPPQQPPFEPRNPYKGLKFFSTEDASDFYGRERLTDELVEKLRLALSTELQGQGQRLLTVVGPSGSGKSSVVLAGCCLGCSEEPCREVTSGPTWIAWCQDLTH